MIRGFLGWQAAGLQPPRAVLAATERYLREEDTLGLWLTECCDTTDPTAETKSGVLYANFKVWKENRGERPGSHKRFAAQIGERFQQDDRAGYVWVQGVALKAPA
jgi:phage/plasmid-associated DNA primase